LSALLDDSTIVETISVRYIAALVRSCKLHDYDGHAWTDFAGNTTSRTRVHEAIIPSVA
jgi:hypothetical protein